MILLDERVVVSREDMSGVEKFVMAQLGCENHRCAFFRSSEYVRFRVAVLYKSETSGCLFFDRLCLKFERVQDSCVNEAVVRVYLNEDMVFEGSKDGWMRSCVGKDDIERKRGVGKKARV